MKFAVIHLPNFFLQAGLRNEPALTRRPVAFTDNGIILQATPSAARLGVAAGLTGSQALARCPGLLLKPRSLGQEATATEIVLQMAYRFSPRIESTDAGTCTLELVGLELENPAACRAWAGNILKTLDTFHLEGRIGFSVTPELARLAARVAEPILVVENTDEFIAQLPVELLAPPPDLLKILKLWGIETAGALVALGRDCVIERLGEAAIELFDSISTISTRPLRLVAPAEIFTETITFEHEIETLEPLLNISGGFIRQLTARLAAIHEVAGELKLELGLASGDKIQRCFKMPAPTNDDKILLRTLRTYLETLKTDSPVVFLTLVITPGGLHSHQFGLFETTLRNPNRFFETLARLGALCGCERVGSPVAEPVHKPDVFRMEKPCFDGPGGFSSQADQNCAAPLRRFRPAISAVIEYAREKPVMVRSRAFSGPITRRTGPYLSSGEWWDERRWSREEWDVQINNGAFCRIVRSSQGDFVEGIYD